MNFFNRALKNVTRKMSKSVLLAVTFFLIGNLVIIGLGINNAAENAKILTRQKNAGGRFTGIGLYDLLQ